MFHRVTDHKSIFYPAMPVSVFQDLCDFIKSNYAVIKISEIESHFHKSTRPAAIISFDDAHYDIIENAMPILAQLNMPFNVNIDTEILETGKPQDFVRVYDILNSTTIESYKHPEFMIDPILIDRTNPVSIENEFTKILSDLTTTQKRELTENLANQAGMVDANFSRMLTNEDVRYLGGQNVEFGSHSHTHSILTKINNEQVHHELKLSKDILESLTQQKVDILAYPNGVFNEEIQKIAQEIGYSVFLETDDRINTVLSNANVVRSYKRVNQYHQTLDEAKAHTYGVLNKIKNLIR